jgi:hypothetical protein
MKKILWFVLVLFSCVAAQEKNNYLLVDTTNVVQGIIQLAPNSQADSAFGGCRVYKFSGDYNPAYLQTRTFDGTTLIEIKPPKWVLTKFEFNSKFTMEELVNIENAATTDVLVKVLMNKFNIAEEIELRDPAVIYGVNTLVEKELLTAERAKEILSPK